MKKNAVILAVVVLTALFIYSGYHKPNALKVHVMGLTQVIRYPHAHTYNENDVVLLRQEDGTYQSGIVVETLSIDSELVDDELTAEEQAENMIVRQALNYKR